jgi:hypothetical protein
VTRAEHLRAKQIAADWHGGQASALYALCSTGTILPPETHHSDGSETVREIDANIVHVERNTDSPTEALRLRQLRHYVVERIETNDLGAVDIWDGKRV